MQSTKQKNITRKRLLVLSIILFFNLLILSLNLVDFSPVDNNNSNVDHKADQAPIIIPKDSATYEDWHYDEQMLTNNGFDTVITPWTNDTSNAGSYTTDYLSPAYTANEANFEVLGENGTFSIIDTPPSSADWTPTKNPDFPLKPNGRYNLGTINSGYGIDSEGCWATHEYDEATNQTDNFPSIHFERNVNMPVNMTDYVITSASVSAYFNAIARTNLEVDGDILGGGGYHGVWDWVRFYVLISDLDDINEFQIANYKTDDLGSGNCARWDIGSAYYMGDTAMIPVNESTLIYYLTSVLSRDYRNFTVTLGIHIYAEDNYPNYDWDSFRRLLIKNFSLEIGYEKKIKQLSSVSWNQQGDQVENIDNPVIENATLQFDYKTNLNWTKTTGSLNSEIRFYIDNELHSETVKLRDVNKTFQTAFFVVSSKIPIGRDINVSIELIIWDEITLGELIIISIDNVYLNVTYYRQPTAEVTTLDLFLQETNVTEERYIEVNMGDLLNITVLYRNSTGDPIDDADNYDIYGDGIIGTDSLENQGAGYYNYSLNTNNLDFGNNYLTVIVEKFAHETRVITNFRVKVLNKIAYISKVLLNGFEQPDDTLEINAGETLNITAEYTNTTLDIIPDALLSNATSTNFNREMEWNVARQHYNISLNVTEDLGVGVSFITLSFEEENYTPRTRKLTIIVWDIGTEYLLYVNNTDKTASPALTTVVDRDLIINFTYRESAGIKRLISDADVSINGSGISEPMYQLGSLNYSVKINTKDLTGGINFLTIYATKTGFEPQSVSLTITIIQTPTNLTLLVDDVDVTKTPSITREIGDFINITTYYREQEPPQDHISGASINATIPGKVFEILESGTFNHYNLTLDTNELNTGVNFVTIYAYLANYQPQSLILIIEIIPKETLLNVSLNGVDRTADVDKSIALDWNELLNVSITYRIDPTKVHIGGATVTIEGGAFSDELKENGQKYNLTINTARLGVGVHYLTILAVRTNYESQTVSIRVEVNNRDTFISYIYINNIDKSVDKTYVDVWNEAFPVSIGYNDTATGAFITGADVTIVGSTLPEKTLPFDGENYTVSLNSYELGVGVHFLTISAEQTNYTTASEVITITINRRPTFIDEIFIDNVNKTTEKTHEDVWNEIFPVSVTYNDSATGALITGAIVSIEGATLPAKSMPLVGQAYTVTLNSYELGVGVHFLTISAQQTNYSSTSEVITITINRRPTFIDEIFIDNVNKTTEKTHEDVWNELFPVSVAYNDSATGAFITGATVTIAGATLPATPMPLVGQAYTVTLNSYELGVGVHYLTISAQQTNYTTASEVITITINRRPTLIDEIFIDNVNRTTEKSYEIAWSELFDVSVTYNDTATGDLITGATVAIAGATLPTKSMPLVGQAYTVTLNSYELGVGNHYLTISAQKTNYSTVTENIIITVTERETKLITDVNATIISNIYQTKIGNTLNITVWYRDNETSNNLVDGTVELLGLEQPKSLTLNGQQWTILIPSENLSLGVKILTLNAKQDNYSLITEYLTFYVAEKGTSYNLFLNGVNYTGNEEITLTVNVLLNISVAYKEELSPHNPIAGADVSINGSGISEQMHYNVHNNYSVLINTDDLNQGINFLTIYATAANYEAQSILLIVSIGEVLTNLTLLVDDVDVTKTPSIIREIGDFINITTYYREQEPPQNHISGASINATIPGKVFVINESETYNHYNLTLDTNDMNLGVNFVTIYAYLANYQPQSLILIIEIIPKETLLNVSLNGVDRTADVDKSITLDWNELLNVSITYRIDPTEIHIGTATVTIEGGDFSDELKENGQKYNLTINTVSLGVGIHYLTIVALKPNYETQSVVIRVEVNNRDTFIPYIFINFENRTTEKTYEIAWNEAFDVSIAYNDTATGAFITSATVSIAGSTLPAKSLPFDGENYTVTLNSYELGVGVHYLTILANKGNYTSASVNIIITVTDRSTLIDDIFINFEDRTTEKTYEIAWNEAFDVSIAYNDTATGAFITSATVSIAGSTLPAKSLPFDGENYTVTLNSYELGVGVHYLTILANKGNYTSASVNIIITVVDRSTFIDKIFINFEDRTTEKTYEIAWNEAFDVSIAYNDTATAAFITSATVSIAGSTLPAKSLPFDGENYTVTLNSYELGVGVHYLTILATKYNYTSASVNIIITVVDRPTFIDYIFINFEDRTTAKTYEIAWNELFPVSIAYNDTATGDFILDDEYITIAGSGLSPQRLYFDDQNYTAILDSLELGVGVHYLTILATKENYTSASVNIIITVTDRSTLIDDIFINLEDRTTEKTYEIAWNEDINVSITYDDMATGAFIMGASVTIAGSGLLPQQLPYDGQNYTVNLNSYVLGVGVHYLTILATKVNYSSASELITITVTDRATLIDEIFINFQNRTTEKTYEIAWNELFPVSIAYNDTVTGALITGATVSIAGSTLPAMPMPLVGQAYTVNLNSYVLGVGVHYLTILANKVNYSSASENIIITVTDRATLIDEIFINFQNRTTEKTYEIAWNELFPVSIAYNDTVTGALITGATVSIAGSTLPATPMPLVGQAYTVNLNSYVLGVGVHYLTILATKVNYSSASENIIITVTDRATLIDEIFINFQNRTTEKTYEIAWNELFPVSIAYNDTDTGALITGATVSIAGSTLPATPMPLVGQAYTVNLNSYVLGVGVHYLTILATKVNYSSASEDIIITVTDRATLIDEIFINFQNRTTEKTYEIAWNELFPVSIAYNDTATGDFIMGATVTIAGSGISDKPLPFDGQNYTVVLNSSELGLGVHYLTILATKVNYSSVSELITITVSNRETYLITNVNVSIVSGIYQTKIGETLDITVWYRDYETDSYLDNATVELRGLAEAKTLTRYGLQYTILMPAENISLGVTILTINAKQDNYTLISEDITVYVAEKGSLYNLFLNGVNYTGNEDISLTVNVLLNISLAYKEELSPHNPIIGALVSINSSGISELLDFNIHNNYSVLINTTDLNQGINFLTIYAQADNYETKSILLIISIVEIQTNLTLYVDGVDITKTPSITRQIDDNINITVYYREQLSTQDYISGASINASIPGDSFEILESGTFQHYNLTLDTNHLNPGVNFITIYALRANYQPQTLILTIEVTPKETLLNISLNGVDRTADVDKSIILKWDELLNVSITYQIDPTEVHIGIATVTIEGGGFSEILKENGQRYNLTINTASLGIGVHYLTILALKSNYEVQSVVIRVDVTKADSKSQLIIDEVEEDQNTFINVYTNLTVNITMIYKDTVLNSKISGANIQLTGGDLPLGLTLTKDDTHGHYSYMLNTSHLGGITNSLTLFAQADNHSSQSIYFSIVIIDMRTDYILLLSNSSSSPLEDRTSKPSIKVVVNDYFRINISFFDNDTKKLLLDANLRLLGEGFNETLDFNGVNYHITIDSDDDKLVSGFNFLKVVAQKFGYQTQDIDFIVEIINRLTEIKIDANGVDVSFAPTLTLPYGDKLKITVNFSDIQTGQIIDGSTVTIEGEGFSPRNFTQVSQYEIEINTVDLDIGIRFLIIFAGKKNYQSKSVTLRINVARIQCEVELLKYDDDEIDIKPGEDVKIRVQLNDLDFGGVIEGARIEYTWEHGDGEMDEKEDGIYEVTLEEVPEGTFTFVITVYAEDEYEFKRKEIDINSIRPEEDVRMLIILATVIPIVSAVGSILAYRQLRIIKTPSFVKKMKALKNIIKKGHSMPVHYVYPYRDEAFFKKYRKDWDKIGIPLNKVLGIKFSEKNLAKVKAKKSKINAYKFKKQKRPKE